MHAKKRAKLGSGGPLERRKTPIRETQRPSYCQFPFEKQSVLIQVSSTHILKRDVNMGRTCTSEYPLTGILSDKFFQFKAMRFFQLNIHNFLRKKPEHMTSASPNNCFSIFENFNPCL